MSALEEWLMLALLEHNVNMLRVEAEAKARVLALLIMMQKDIVSILANAPAMSELGKLGKNAILRESNAVIAEYYGKAALQVDLFGIAEVESMGVKQALTTALEKVAGPASVEIRIGLALPTENYLQKLASDVLVQGSPAKSWWLRQQQDTQFKLANEIRIGAAQGETNAQIIKRVVGRDVTVAKAPAAPGAVPAIEPSIPGVMPLARKNAAAIVQTSMATVSGAARRATFAANTDITNGIMQVSTMDSHTCFTAGHLVLMADGSEKVIESIQPGDMVIGGLSKLPRRVVAILNTVRSTVDICTNKGHTFTCTHEHLFMTDKGWVAAYDLKDKHLCTYVSEQKAVRRPDCEPDDEVDSTLLGISGSQRQDAGGREAGSLCGNQEIFTRNGDDGDYRNPSDARTSSRGREVGDCAPGDVLPKRLQHDGGRRGSGGAAGAYPKSERGNALAPLQGRPGVCREDAGCCQTRRAEGVCRANEVVGDARISSAKSTALITESEGCRLGEKPESNTGNISEDRARNRCELGQGGISAEGKCCARRGAGLAAARSGVDGEKARGDVGIHEVEVARPGIYCKARSSTGNARGESKDAGGQQNEENVCPGSCSRQSREDASGKACKLGRPCLSSQDDGSFTTAIRVEEAGKRVVYDIQVESPDESFICNGAVVHNSMICIAYSGAQWDHDFEPMSGNDLPYNGGVPRHFNCRSSEIAVMKSLREMGIDMDEPDPGMRASSNGPISAKTTFADFLKLKGADYQNEVLGPGRADLFRQGKLSPRDLVSAAGKPLGLDVLRAKYAAGQ